MGLKCLKCGADNPVTEMRCLECGEKLELQNVTKEQLMAEGKEGQKKKLRENRRRSYFLLKVLVFLLVVILLVITAILIPRRSQNAPESFPREKRLQVMGYQKVVSVDAKRKESFLWRKIPQLPGVQYSARPEQVVEFSSGEATAWFLAAVHWKEILEQLSESAPKSGKRDPEDSAKTGTDPEGGKLSPEDSDSSASPNRTSAIPMELQECSLVMLSENRIRVILTWKTWHGLSLDLSADYDVRYKGQKLEFQCHRIWLGWLPLFSEKKSRQIEDKVFRALFAENSYLEEEWKRLRPRLKDIRIHSGRLELVY